MAATPGLLDTDRLAALGLALRALLCLEIRTVRLMDTLPIEEQPNHIVAGTTPVRATVHTASGVEISVVIGVPSQVCAASCMLCWFWPCCKSPTCECGCEASECWWASSDPARSVP